MEAYIVIKSRPLNLNDIPYLTYDTNEGVFATEDLAKEYIRLRKKSKDRDDRGCEFKIEPWRLQTSL